MTIDPALLVAAIAALGGLLIFIVRLFLTGAVLPRSAVPREDYDALAEVNASQFKAFERLTAAVTRLAVTIDRIAPRNGGKDGQ